MGNGTLPKTINARVGGLGGDGMNLISDFRFYVPKDIYLKKSNRYFNVTLLLWFIELVELKVKLGGLSAIGCCPKQSSPWE